MNEIGNIFLSWHSGRADRRHIVGKLQRNSSEGVRFSYLTENIGEAMRDGFSPYTEFPDIEKIYNQDVLTVFGQRLIKSERSDIQDFYDFWEIDTNRKDDIYYMLAHTQGLNPADNFEFLADYNPTKELHFTTDLAGLTYLQIPLNGLSVGDVLTYQLEPNNLKDRKAVMVFKGSKQVGYIKKIHCNVFYKSGETLNLKVKALERNGVLKRVFVKVFS